MGFGPVPFKSGKKRGFELMARYKFGSVALGLALGMAIAGTRFGFAQDEELGTLPADEASAIAGDPTKDNGENEVIQERFPSTLVKIERYVTRDSEGNYINHGPYTQWDENGQLVTKGQYKHGKRHGRWMRWYGPNHGQMFSGPNYEGFERPFLSEVNYDEGVVDGMWTVIDAKNRKITEWCFEHDVQEGPAIWYYPSGQKHREVTFHNGHMENELIEWGTDNKIALKEVYLDGRKLGTEVENYSAGKKRAERGYSYSVARINFNAAEATAQIVPADKKDEKLPHGHSTWWYSNGQKQSEGNFKLGVPDGIFVWWHSNGQKQTQGEYVNGKETGRWIWWHANGMRMVQGQYTSGQQIGTWSSWKEDGQLNSVENFSATPNSDRAEGKPELNPEIGSLPAKLPVLRK
jgi:antitoxin component YwqK of YwqJK toxin-antitoxin module